MVADPTPSRSGTLVAIVGPSGSGKDTLINWARTALSHNERIHFARRVVTRPISDDSEAHDTMSDSQFCAAEQAGQFCMTWRAHGLSYGIPRDVMAHCEDGKIVVLNGARRALGDLRRRFSLVVVVHISVDEQTLRHRLYERGRESTQAIEERIAESVRVMPDQDDVDFWINNSGVLADAGMELVSIIQGLASSKYEHDVGRPDHAF